MPSPDWRMVVAADSATEVRARRKDDGSISLRLSSGPISIVASISDEQLAFLIAREPAPAQGEAA